MSLDIIITTYNRSQRASQTVQQFLELKNPFFDHIIVVDSSDGLSATDYPDDNEVIYVRSTHKNQPYQRFLGYTRSDAEILLYLDDDMDLLDGGGLCSELLRFEGKEIAGITFGFRNDNVFLAEIPKNVTAELGGVLGRGLKWFTGAPVLGENLFWLCGLRGKREGSKPIEYIQGGAFAVRRSDLYQDFNFCLFDLFEQKIGMGEDVILGHGLSNQGFVWAAEGETFYHNDQEDSSYTIDLYFFNRRVACSRLFLSLEFVRLSGQRTLLARLHYQWYMLWRTAGLSLSLVVHPNRGRWDSLRGWLAGWWCALMWKPRTQETAAQFWLEEMEKDLDNA